MGEDSKTILTVSGGGISGFSERDIGQMLESVTLPDGWTFRTGGELHRQPELVAGNRVLALYESPLDDSFSARHAAEDAIAAGAAEARIHHIGFQWRQTSFTTEDVAGWWAAAKVPLAMQYAVKRAAQAIATEAGGLTLDIAPSGRNGTATVTARQAGDTLACESFNLTKAKQRADFARAVCDGRDGIDAAAIEAELLKTAADLANRGNGDAQPQGDMPEVDLSRIIRPERFITPDVSGVAIPSMMQMDDKVAGRWLLYLRWQDGKRERQPLASALDLPGDGGRLWIHPEPMEPGPTTAPGWSADARHRWLEGEPAPTAADVFKRLAESFARFIDLPKVKAPGITATAVCWAMLTYCYHAWPAVPYLFIGGPLGSGKSRLFEVLGRLVFRPLASSNLTAAALFRTLHTRGGALLLDEAERLKQSRDPDVSEILSMLLAGYKRGASALRLEPAGDSFRAVSFDVFGPKALACIAGLPPALASRSIPITMFRAAPGSDKPKRRIDAAPGGWQRLRDDLHALALEHGPTWLALPDRADVVPSGLSGRDYELWQPLLAIAAFIESSGLPGLVELMQTHALEAAESAKDDAQPDHDEALLRLLADAVRYGERPTPGDLLARAKEGESGDGFNRWTPRAVAEHLKRYGLATIKTDGKKRYARVTVDDLARIEESYGIDLGTSDQ